MKKVLKQISAFLLTLLLLLSFAGCARLDQMRQQQVFASDDGGILWNGYTYLPLPESEYFMPEMDYNTSLYLTASDVPVLLSEIFATEVLYASPDGRFLNSIWNGGGTFYCREDQYAQIADRILAPFTSDLICYSYEVFDEEAYEYVVNYYTLTEEQIAVITQVIETIEPMPSTEGWYLDYDRMVQLEKCSQDMLFRANCLVIAVSGDTYYVTYYSGEEALTCAVPKAYNDTFDQIVHAYWNS